MSIISSIASRNLLMTQGTGARLASVAMPQQFVRGSNYQSPILSSATFTRTAVSGNVNRSSAVSSYYGNVSSYTASQYRANSTTSSSASSTSTVKTNCIPCAAKR